MKLQFLNRFKKPVVKEEVKKEEPKITITEQIMKDKKTNAVFQLAVKKAFQLGKNSILQEEEMLNDTTQSGDIKNSSNFYATGFNEIGYNYLSQGYVGKGQLNTPRMWQKFSDNFIFTLYPYFIGRMLKSSSLMRCVVEYPCQDAFSDYQITQTETNLDKEDVTKFQKKYNKNHFKIIEAIVKTATFGGGAIILAGDKNELSEPLNYQKGDTMYLKTCDRWSLMGTDINHKLEDVAKLYEEGKLDDFNINTKNEFVYYAGVKVHKSRVIPVVNDVNKINMLYENVLQGWSFSTFEALRIPLFEFMIGQESLTELLPRMRYNVLGVEDLKSKSNLMGGEAFSEVLSYIEMIETTSNTHDTILMDKNDNYQTITTDVDIQKLYNGLITILSLNAGIPSSRFTGGEGGGNFNSASENESERSYRRLLVNKQQHYENIFNKIIELQSICEYGENLGFEISFETKKQQSPEQKRAYATSLINEIVSLKNAGILSNEDATKIINTEEIYGIKLEAQDNIEKDVDVFEKEEVDEKDTKDI